MEQREAKEKEAARTLARITGTLQRLQDDSASPDSLADNDEYRRMKCLLESGYQRQGPAMITRLQHLMTDKLLIWAIVISMILGYLFYRLT